MRVYQQPAYVLLNRPYSETSWIVEVFTQDYGRIALMAKGARRLKSKLKGILQPFQAVLLSWSGKGEMPTLTAAELQTDYFNSHDSLVGDAMICAFYCNELLVNLLHRYDPHQSLFKEYRQTILQLTQSSSMLDLNCFLREFERKLIKEVGYGVDFQHTADGKSQLLDHQYYTFEYGHGFVNQLADYPISSKAVRGDIIKSLASHTKSASVEQIRDSRKIMRQILDQMLGRRKIHSRELFFPK